MQTLRGCWRHSRLAHQCKAELNLENVWGYSSFGVEYNELDVTFTDGYLALYRGMQGGQCNARADYEAAEPCASTEELKVASLPAVSPNTESVKKKKDARLMLWSGASLSEQITAMMNNSITERAEASEATP